MSIVATFKGAKDAEGNPVEYLGGIPARSLDEDDMAALTKEQREAVATSKLYTMRGEAPPERRAERTEPAVMPPPKEGAAG